ncbi:MAG: transglycosylase domain-containing protein [Campylobacterales bacterium]
MKIFLKIIFVVFIGIFVGGVAFIVNEFDKAHKGLEPLINYKPETTTRIYDTNGELIANLFLNHHRLYVPFEKLPPRVIESLLATEDTLFFEHHGINFDAIFRAMLKNLKSGRIVEGASTITQQLIKTTVLTPEKTFERKINEAIMAFRLETLLSKEEILERYLNQIYFGHGYYGIRTASIGYFKKELDKLTLKEIAMLIALPRAPSFYDPTKNMKLNLSRANKIIYRLYSLGWIDKEQFDEAIKETPVVYDETLTQNRAPYVVDEVLRGLGDKYKDIKSGGYEIETTVDLEMQAVAKESLKEGYEAAKERMEKNDFNSSKLNGALVSIDSSTGEIKSLVGGVDYKSSNYNRATQSQRQPGSAFKPFIYLSALNLGYSPYSKIPDIARTYKYKKDGEEMLWKPENYAKDLFGMVTLKKAVVKSINIATINLADEIGLSKLFEQLDKLGFKDLPRNLSIALGSFGISPVELAGKYSVFSNYGTEVRPYLIKTIKKNGKTIESSLPKENKVCPAKQSYLMIDVLKSAVKSGTGRRADVKGIEIGGKTGTTNDYKDAWFCGFTPTLSSIIWFGNDDYSPMPHGMAGGVVAAPVFKSYMEKVLKIHPQLTRDFHKPEGVKEIRRGGSKYLFTDISKLPAIENENEEKNQEDQLIF